MKNDKGILGKLLSIAGFILVVVGVFVFQGVSRANDALVDPADVGGVGLSATNQPDVIDPDGGSAVDSVDSDTNDASAPEQVANVLSVKYYNGGVLMLDDTSNEAEKTFVISDIQPVGDSEFLAWYDEINDKYYTAGDEVVLNAENKELILLAKFVVRKTFELNYDTNGGFGGPSTDIKESTLDTCDFTISTITPIREGYEFKGWQKADDSSITYAPGASIRSRSSDAPLVLKAVWAELRTYTLIYEGNGGSGAPEVEVCKSAEGFCKFVVSATTPTRASFEFIDWQKGTETVGPGAEITVKESITILVANWNPVAVFTLEYVADDAKDIPEPAKCESAMGTCTFIIADKEPTREGYRFKGWRLEGKDDMLAKAGDELIVGIDGPLNLRIIAIWSKIYPVMNSGEVFGAGERVVLRSGADYSTFKSLTIDSEPVPEDYFTVNEGGATSVALSNAFSQALSVGEHAFTIEWEDGEANGIISVNQSEDGTKRFVIVDAKGSVDGVSLMLRPKAGAVSKESVSGVVDSAKDNGDSNFDAVRTLILVAAAVFVVIYLVNRFYIRRKMEFIENL